MMDALKLARDAGLEMVMDQDHAPRWISLQEIPPPALQRFADLVLEEAAKVCENYQWSLDLTQADVARAIRAMKGKP